MSKDNACKPWFEIVYFWMWTWRLRYTFIDELKTLHDVCLVNDDERLLQLLSEDWPLFHSWKYNLGLKKSRRVEDIRNRPSACLWSMPLRGLMDWPETRFSDSQRRVSARFSSPVRDDRRPRREEEWSQSWTHDFRAESHLKHAEDQVRFLFVSAQTQGRGGSWRD
jgi:hypothetical protein